MATACDPSRSDATGRRTRAVATVGGCGNGSGSSAAPACAGEVRVVGAKNSALKLMAGALLAVGRTRLTNVPDIVDVTIMAELLRRLGCDGGLGGRTTVVVEIDVPERIGHRADYELVRALRASICVLGPLDRARAARRTSPSPAATPSARAASTCTPRARGPGREGPRAHGYLIAAAPQGLHGASVRLEFPSVGATENVLMAAVLATGHTRIENAAREPEIADIAEFLVSMGAQSTGPAPRPSRSTASTRSTRRSTTSSPTASPPAAGRSRRRRLAAMWRSSAVAAGRPWSCSATR